MFDQLLENGIINREDVLLLNYKKLKISEHELVIVLLILKLEKMNLNPITLQTLQTYTYFNVAQLDKLVVSLMNKGLLVLNGYSISTKPLNHKIKELFEEPNEHKVKQEKKVNLVDAFQKEFGRSLTPLEIETLKAWKQCQYSDEMILKALKEATMSNVKNLRYIEKILVDWAKYGIKTSGREKIEDTSKTIELSNYRWWEDD